MTNLTQTVWKFLDSQPSVKRELNRGIINSMALAKYIIQVENLNCSPDAVISAIRRYSNEKKTDIKYQQISSIIKESRISTKSRIALIALKRSSVILEHLPKVFPLIEINRSDVLRISEGKEAIKLMVDEKNVEKVIQLFPKDRVINVIKNLSELSIQFSPESKERAGVIGYIMNEISVNNIEIVEAIGCLPEFMMFFDTKDLLKAHEILMGLIEG